MKLTNLAVFLLYKCSSILMGMGDQHFTHDKIVQSQQLVLQFVLNLFREKVEQEHRDQSALQEPPLGVVQEGAVNDGIPAAAAPAPDSDNQEDDDEMFMMGLMNAGASLPASTHGYTLDSMMEDLKNNIEQEFQSYVDYCKKINWPEVLSKHGTEKYKKLFKDKQVNEKKMNVNPRYIRSFFDVIGWWRDTGYKLFPKLAVAALIVLAKATHNGYQERVFSIGTFLDTKQQKRREARHYEMDVLQRINGGMMQEEEYWAEIQRTPDAQNDKEMMESFFAVTENIQIEQEAKPAADKIVDDALQALADEKEDDDGVISVPNIGPGDDTGENQVDNLVPYWDIADSDDDSDS
jgi:hypothetical protein